MIEAKARFEAAGVSVRSEDDTVCRYARQDKFWVQDPDGNEWERFANVNTVVDHEYAIHAVTYGP